MARTARVVTDNTIYHVITRGNQKQNVFRDQVDYQEYLKLLQKYKHQYNFQIYCFCLMPNHVHLLLEISKGNLLNKIMRGITLSYTIYFNYRYKTVGHLWQGRYKSKIISRDAYLLECINYIEANPIRAGFTEEIDQYQWSSNFLRDKIEGLITETFDF
jgi:putative transposase